MGLSQYMLERRALKTGVLTKPEKTAAETKKEEARKDKKKNLKKFFKSQDDLAPLTCENCGISLEATRRLNKRAHIAHIVAKGKHGCPSVATNKHNRWYACVDCHTDFDSKSPELVSQMQIIPILQERLKLFFNDIKESERRRIQPFLLS